MTFTDFNYESSYVDLIWMLELILADQLADLHLPFLASRGQEWQFHISTVRVHIGKSTGRSTPHKYWYLVVKNGNFSFLLLSIHIGRSTGRSSPHFSAMHHGVSIMGCIWQPLWILQEKVGICFHF